MTKKWKILIIIINKNVMLKKYFSAFKNFYYLLLHLSRKNHNINLNMDVDEVPLDQELSEDTKKFILDLEFVQCLANPEYLKCIFAARKIIEKKNNNNNIY